LDRASDRAGQPLDPDKSRSWLESRDSLARLRWGWDTFGEHFALTTSFGIQSAVLLHQVSQLAQSLGGVKIPVIWVDTGYLPPETYRYAEQLLQRLPIDLRVV
jgi:phosphoadenosine phosphosulfate reductase